MPVLLDPDVEPPLRFRQLQTVSLARWTGRNDSSAFARLAAALREREQSPVEPPAIVARPPAIGPKKRAAAGTLKRLAAMLMVSVVGGVVLFGYWLCC